MFVVRIVKDNTILYLKDGAVMNKWVERHRKLPTYDPDYLDRLALGNEKSWLTNDLNQARIFNSKSAASCAAGRGPYEYEVVEVQRSIEIKVV